MFSLGEGRTLSTSQHHPDSSPHIGRTKWWKSVPIAVIRQPRKDCPHNDLRHTKIVRPGVSWCFVPRLLYQGSVHPHGSWLLPWEEVFLDHPPPSSCLSSWRSDPGTHAQGNTSSYIGLSAIPPSLGLLADVPTKQAISGCPWTGQNSWKPNLKIYLLGGGMAEWPIWPQPISHSLAYCIAGSGGNRLG